MPDLLIRLIKLFGECHGSYIPKVHASSYYVDSQQESGHVLLLTENQICIEILSIGWRVGELYLSAELYPETVLSFQSHKCARKDMDFGVTGVMTANHPSS